MEAPSWRRGDIELAAARSSDWPALASLRYVYLYDDQPPQATSATSWWSQLWALPVVVRRGGDLVGYLRTARAAPDSLRCELRAGFAEIVGDGAVAAPAARLYVALLFSTLPLHRLHLEVPDDGDGAAFARALLEAGFREEGHYPSLTPPHASAVTVLGVLRRDVP
jgi:hypothetical protein